MPVKGGDEFKKCRAVSFSVIATSVGYRLILYLLSENIFFLNYILLFCIFRSGGVNFYTIV